MPATVTFIQNVYLKTNHLEKITVIFTIVLRN